MSFRNVHGIGVIICEDGTVVGEHKVGHGIVDVELYSSSACKYLVHDLIVDDIEQERWDHISLADTSFNGKHFGLLLHRFRLIQGGQLLA